jgi:drug/metabolite transporter (DMT)-like permease
MTGIPGLSSAFYRVAIAFLIFLPIAVYHRYYIIESSKLGLSLLCGLFFAMDLGCWNQSLMITNTAVATVLGNLAPVWAGILLYIFTSHKPTMFYWAGVILALAGLIIMIGWSTVRHLNFDHGSVLALIGSFFYACYMVITGKAREGTSTMTFMFYSMLGYLVASFIIAIVFHAPLNHFSSHSWWILILLAIVPQLLGWICVNHALGTLPSTEVSMVLLSQIVIASLLATIIFKEILTANQIMGGVVIIIGIGITYIRKFNPRT